MSWLARFVQTFRLAPSEEELEADERLRAERDRTVKRDTSALDARVREVCVAIRDATAEPIPTPRTDHMPSLPGDV